MSFVGEKEPIEQHKHRTRAQYSIQMDDSAPFGMLHALLERGGMFLLLLVVLPLASSDSNDGDGESSGRVAQGGVRGSLLTADDGSVLMTPAPVSPNTTLDGSGSRLTRVVSSLARKVVAEVFNDLSDFTVSVGDGDGAADERDLENALGVCVREDVVVVELSASLSFFRLTLWLSRLSNKSTC